MGNIHTVEEIKRSVAWLRCRALDRCEEYAEAEDDYRDVADQMDGLLSRCALLEALVRELESGCKAACGYLLNAKIDLETGAPKRTAIATIEGGLKTVRAALSHPLVYELTGEKEDGE